MPSPGSISMGDLESWSPSYMLRSARANPREGLHRSTPHGLQGSGFLSGGGWVGTASCSQRPIVPVSSRLVSAVRGPCGLPAGSSTRSGTQSERQSATAMVMKTAVSVVNLKGLNGLLAEWAENLTCGGFHSLYTFRTTKSQISCLLRSVHIARLDVCLYKRMVQVRA